MATARRHPGWIAPLGMTLVLGLIYWATLLPGVGHLADTVEFQFSGHLLCVTHPTGYPTYLLLLHAFSNVLPFGTVAFRANLLSSVFSLLTCLVLRRLLSRLGTGEVAACATALAFGLTPTFWRHSVTAEVYSLHALFIVLVADRLLEWRRTRRQRDLLLGCGLYALSFGNHLTAVTLLPAVAFVLLATRVRVLLEWRSVVPVCGVVALGALQYLYPVWRSRDPGTPYLATEVTNVSALWNYATGASFRGAMFAFTPQEVLRERLPFFIRLWWGDCGPLLGLAALGLARIKDRVLAGFLGLVFLGNAAFGLTYAIGEIHPFFIPNHLVTDIVAGLGLARVLSWAGTRKTAALLAFLLPAGLCAFHWTRVVEATLPGKAEPMRALLEEVGGRALLIPRYEQYMQLLYLDLIEGRAGPAVFIGFDIPVEDVAAYLKQDQPIYLPRVRRWVPPGLPVYSTALRRRPRYRAAGLTVRLRASGAYRISGPARPSPP